MQANMDVTTAHYEDILTGADAEADRHANVKTDVMAPPPLPSPAQIA